MIHFYRSSEATFMIGYLEYCSQVSEYGERQLRLCTGDL
jgi:hypothetical protein